MLKLGASATAACMRDYWDQSGPPVIVVTRMGTGKHRARARFLS